MVAYGCPLSTADDADVFDGQDGKEEVLVGPVIPILIHIDGNICLLGLLQPGWR